MYRVSVSNKSGYSFNAETEGGRFNLEAKGGGIRPLDALLAGLGSCIGVYIRRYIEGARLKLDEFEVKVEADFSGKKPVYFRVINVFIDLKNYKLDERRKKSLLEFVKNCPAHNNLKLNTDVNVTFTPSGA